MLNYPVGFLSWQFSPESCIRFWNWRLKWGNAFKILRRGHSRVSSFHLNGRKYVLAWTQNEIGERHPLSKCYQMKTPQAVLYNLSPLNLITLELLMLKNPNEPLLYFGNFRNGSSFYCVPFKYFLSKCTPEHMTCDTPDTGSLSCRFVISLYYIKWKMEIKRL